MVDRANSERGFFHHFSGSELRVGNGKTGVEGSQNALVFPWVQVPMQKRERETESGTGCLVVWGRQTVSERGLYSMETGGQKDGGHRGVTGSLARRWVWEFPTLNWTFPLTLLFAFSEFALGVCWTIMRTYTYSRGQILYMVFDFHKTSFKGMFQVQNN